MDELTASEAVAQMIAFAHAALPALPFLVILAGFALAAFAIFVVYRSNTPSGSDEK